MGRCGKHYFPKAFLFRFLASKNEKNISSIEGDYNNERLTCCKLNRVSVVKFLVHFFVVSPSNLCVASGIHVDLCQIKASPPWVSKFLYF